MKFFLVIVLAVFSCYGMDVVLAQDNAKTADLAQDKAVLKDLEDLRDPFVSPFKKSKPVLAKDVEPKPQPQPEPKPQVPVKPTIVPVKPPVVRQEPKKPEVSPVRPAVVPGNVEPAFTFGNMQLNGVVWNTALPQAIIADRVVRVGDDLNGAEITAITKDGLEVVHKGKRYILTIKTEAESASDLKSGAKPPALKGNPQMDMRRKVNEKR